MTALKLVLLAFCFVLIGSCVSSKSSSYTHNRKNPPKLVWISLDGMQFAELEKRVAQIKSPHPKGFHYLLSLSNKNPALIISNPTITAPSHISTITCSPSAVHGVFANYNWNGEKFESGFSTAYKPQTFHNALLKKNIFVASYGYASIDGTHENRTASVGATYDNPRNKGQVVVAPWNSEGKLRIPLRNNTTVGVTLNVGENGSQVTLSGDNFKHVLEIGKWQDLYFETPEGLNHAAVLFLNVGDRRVSIYFSPTMLNAAFPADFRERLDAQKIVFSPGKDYSLRTVDEASFMKSVEHRLQHFEAAANFILEIEKPEAFFLYFEDLDVLGHQYKGIAEADALVQSHFEKFDNVLGNLLSRLAPSTNVVVVGDHGMAEILVEVNANAFLPKVVQEKLEIVSSGGSLFLYGRGKALNSLPPKHETWVAELVQALKAVPDPISANSKLFERVVVKGSAEAGEIGLQGENSPWIAAIAKSSFRVKQSVEKEFILAKKKNVSLNAAVRSKYKMEEKWLAGLKEPMPAGDHGHLGSLDEMRTSLFFVGPELDKISAASVKMNTEIVPKVASALAWPHPENCK